jgi:GntP family gluconate:H+ symporter
MTVLAAVVVLIVWLKVHPFVSLILGSAVLGVAAAVGLRLTPAVASVVLGHQWLGGPSALKPS